MNDPVAAWLSAKLDEVEARAKAAEGAAPSPWRSYEGQGIVEHSGPESTSYLNYERGNHLWDSEDCTEGWRRLCMDEAVAAHVAGMDPATVLRLVAATRALLELHYHPSDTTTHCTLCGWGEGRGNPEDGYWPCDTIRAVAEGWGWVE